MQGEKRFESPNNNYHCFHLFKFYYQQISLIHTYKGLLQHVSSILQAFQGDVKPRSYALFF
jgi:hypothetical protein